ncbi:MAG: acetate kinase, partial [Planctomycetota bacterium]
MVLKMKVLVINAGSSSVKYHLYSMPQEEVLAHGAVERIGEKSSKLSHFFNGKTHTVQIKA